MTKTPSISPLQAMERLRAEGEFSLDGFKYSLDGPAMSPPEAWSPVAEGEDGDPWFSTGEPGDPITETDTWVGSGGDVTRVES